LIEDLMGFSKERESFNDGRITNNTQDPEATLHIHDKNDDQSTMKLNQTPVEEIKFGDNEF
jgi:hypothetical protein